MIFIGDTAIIKQAYDVHPVSDTCEQAEILDRNSFRGISGRQIKQTKTREIPHQEHVDCSKMEAKREKEREGKEEGGRRGEHVCWTGCTRRAVPMSFLPFSSVPCFLPLTTRLTVVANLSHQLDSQTGL